MEKERECVFDCCNQERGERKWDIFSSSRERMRMCSFRPREGERANIRERRGRKEKNVIQKDMEKEGNRDRVSERTIVTESQ